MKAIVEFEVNGCGDCLLNDDELQYCMHPCHRGKLLSSFEEIRVLKYAELGKFPDWCPILGNNPHLAEK